MMAFGERRDIAKTLYLQRLRNNEQVARNRHSREGASSVQTKRMRCASAEKNSRVKSTCVST